MRKKSWVLGRGWAEENGPITFDKVFYPEFVVRDRNFL